MLLKAWMNKGEAVLVDVHEPSEHAGERILGARLALLSSFNLTQVPQEPNKKVVLHCLTSSVPRRRVGNFWRPVLPKSTT